MWIVSWNPFLMKILLKKEVCGSREQCTGPIGKVETHFSQKKKKKKSQMQDVDAIQTSSKSQT